MFGRLGSPRRGTVVVALCVAFMAGVGWASMAHLPFAPRLLWLCVPVVVVAWRRQTWAGLGVLVLFGVAIGLWRGELFAQRLHIYDRLWNRNVVIVGWATQDGVYGSRYQLMFEMNHARIIAPKPVLLAGALQISGFGASSVRRGDRVEVRGTLKPALGNDQAEIGFGQLTVQPGRASWIDHARRTFTAGVQSALPEPLASFGMGLLIGERNTLPGDVSKVLLMVGLTHLIAVSGYNLTIVIDVVRRLLGGRSKFQMAALCVGLLGVFVSLTGASASVVRAAIISGLSLGAWYVGRRIQPLVLLLVAAVVTVYINPLYLWGNVSWWLSFLAFFGVVVLSPLLTRRWWGGRQPRLIGQIMLESFCAELMTLPYVLHEFGQISWVALLANVLVAAWVPLAMLLTFVAGLAGMLAPALAGWLAWPAQWLLGYMLDMSTALSRIPHVFVQHIGFSFGQMLVTYALVGATAILVWGKTRAPNHATITERNKRAHVQTEGAIP